MATISKLPSGCWRVQVRRKGNYVSESFLRRGDAELWARTIEGKIDRGEPIHAGGATAKTFGNLIDLHREDLAEVGKELGRSKAASLDFLARRLGNLKPAELSREKLIEFGRQRAKEGAGPVTVGIDLGYIKTILSHAAAVHGIIAPTEGVDLARITLSRLGLVGKGNERDRRPSEDEIDAILNALESDPRQYIPVARVVRFAIATAMRQDEICRVRWGDYNPRTRMLLIRDRKDPRRKTGNDQRIPLLFVSGYDPCALIEEQRAVAAEFSLTMVVRSERPFDESAVRPCRSARASASSLFTKSTTLKKRPRLPRRMQARAMLTARWDLPVPVPPMRTTLR